MNNKVMNEIVISSRIRLARNIDGLPFSDKISPDKAALIPRDVYSSLAGTDTYTIYRMSEISEVDGNVLKEKHLISDDLLKNEDTGAAIINESETVSILINEEDHIREQCILPGFSLKEAFGTVNSVDDAISKKVRFAYSDKLGYLTACPTNLGTGMRASAMMFLPGLSIYNSLQACVNAISRLNMTIRGVYGEGSDSVGYIYQVSNQKTLGVSERQIIDAVETSVGHIAEAELKARDTLKNSGGDELKDKIMRAYGILTNAYKIDSKEFMQLIALVNLGVYYGYIKLTDREQFIKLITNAQPANIASLSNKDLGGNERDVFRAKYASKILSSITKK